MTLLNEIVNKLNEIDFIAEKALEISHNFQIIESLDEAESLINAIKWENFTLEMGNIEIYDYLFHKDKKLLNEWNSVIRTLKHEFQFDNYIDEAIGKGKLTLPMKSQITFDLIGIGGCLYYEKLIGANFPFHQLLYEVYQSGYIPVGYEGTYPNGVLKVY